MSEPGSPLAEESARDDSVAAFQLEGRSVRGRLVRLGGVIDDIIGAHDYGEEVGRLVGETVALAVLVGASLKFDGRLIVQASGAGPVTFLVADYESTGHVRGFAKADEAALAALLAAEPRPDADALLGGAHLAMTIDQGPDFNRYQSLAAIEGGSLAAAAERYFETSEQVPTRLRLAVGVEQVGDGPPRWRAGGAILQRIAGDEARGDTDEDWDYAAALFDTVEDVELLDRQVTPDRLLLRLFHEEGVRLFPADAIAKRCTCSNARIARVLASFPESEIAELTEGDERVRVTCEYCNRDFLLDLDDVASERRRA
ncbi:MAG: Hsp33 family molecular chaperone [Caulobacterales bacterium]|nr:Hsp33 family molecular chaperone [Caulobacterales bacterium]